MAEKVVITTSGKTLDEALVSGDVELKNISSESTQLDVLAALEKIRTFISQQNVLASQTNAQVKKDKKIDKPDKNKVPKDPVTAINNMMMATHADLKTLHSILNGAKDPEWAHAMMKKLEDASDIRPLLKEVKANLKKQGIDSGKTEIKNIENQKQMLSSLSRSHQKLVGLFPKILQPTVGKVLHVADAARGRGLLGGLEAVITHLPPHLAKLGGAALILGKIFYEVIEHLQIWNKTLFQTSSVGASFNNSLINLRVSAAQTGLTLEEFAALISKNSASLASYGGTVTKGADAFTHLSNTVLKKYGNELNAMGISLSEYNEALPIFLELNRAGAFGQKQNLDQQASSFKNLLYETDAMAKLTGKSRSAILSEVQKRQQDAAVQLKMSRMDVGQRDRINQAMVRMEAQFGETGAEMVKLRMLGLPPLTEEMRLAAASMPGLYGAINGVTDSAMDQANSAKNFSIQLDNATADAVVSAMQAAQGMESVLAAGGAGLGGTASEMAKIYKDVVSNNIKYMTASADGVMEIDKDKVKFAIQQAKEEQGARDLTKNTLDGFTNAVKELVGEIWESTIKPLYTVLSPVFAVIGKVGIVAIKALTGAFKIIGIILRPLIKIGAFLADALVPVFKLLDGVVGSLMEGVEQTAGLFNEISDSALGTWLATLPAMFGSFLSQFDVLFKFVGEIIDFVGSLSSLISDAIFGVISLLLDGPKKWMQSVLSGFNKFGEILSTSGKWIVSSLWDTAKFLLTPITFVANKLVESVSWVIDSVSSFYNWLTSFESISDMIDNIAVMFKNTWDKISGFFGGIFGPKKEEAITGFAVAPRQPKSNLTTDQNGQQVTQNGKLNEVKLLRTEITQSPSSVEERIQSDKFKPVTESIVDLTKSITEMIESQKNQSTTEKPVTSLPVDNGKALEDIKDLLSRLLRVNEDQKSHLSDIADSA